MNIDCIIQTCIMNKEKTPHHRLMVSQIDDAVIRNAKRKRNGKKKRKKERKRKEEKAIRKRKERQLNIKTINRAIN